MPAPDAAAVAVMVARADEGDVSAKNALFVSLYDELHRLAEGHLRRSGGSSAATSRSSGLTRASGSPCVRRKRRTSEWSPADGIDR